MSLQCCLYLTIDVPWQLLLQLFLKVADCTAYPLLRLLNRIIVVDNGLLLSPIVRRYMLQCFTRFCPCFVHINPHLLAAIM